VKRSCSNQKRTCAPSRRLLKPRASRSTLCLSFNSTQLNPSKPATQHNNSDQLLLPTHLYLGKSSIKQSFSLLAFASLGHHQTELPSPIAILSQPNRTLNLPRSSTILPLSYLYQTASSSSYLSLRLPFPNLSFSQSPSFSIYYIPHHPISLLAFARQSYPGSKHQVYRLFHTRQHQIDFRPLLAKSELQASGTGRAEAIRRLSFRGWPRYSPPVCLG
jgi:hypothetical protein